MIDNETERRLNAFLRDKGVNPEGNDEVIHPDPVSALCAAYEELEYALGVSRSSNRQRQERNEELDDNEKLRKENKELMEHIVRLEKDLEEDAHMQADAYRQAVDKIHPYVEAGRLPASLDASLYHLLGALDLLKGVHDRIEQASRDEHLCQHNDDIARGLEIALEIAKGKR